MQRNINSSVILRGALALASLCAMLAFALWPRMHASQDESPTPTPVPSSTPKTVFGEEIAALKEEVAVQEETDRLILAELRTGEYSLTEPLILENPYGGAPLCALAAFTSESPVSIQVRVHGKTADADIAHDFSIPQTEHLIPIYGLYPDFLNTVTLTATDSSGKISEATIQIQTEAIERGLIGNMIIQTDSTNTGMLAQGVNFLFTHKVAFDAHGDIRWLNNTWSELAATLYDYGAGTYITASGAYHEGDVLFMERNLLGKFLRVWYSPFGAHHDIAQGENGNLLVAGSKGDSIEDYIYELDGSTGEVIHALDLKTILPRSSERLNAAQQAQSILNDNWRLMASDWFHLNAILWDDGDVILSGRSSSAVVKLDWPSGQIEWIMASPFGWLPMYQKYLLTPKANQAEFEWSYFQHAPCLLPDQDNNPDTQDILLFDNGTIRFGEPDVRALLRTGKTTEIQNYTRMVHYRINEKEQTIEQIWQYGKERGEELYSERCGDANSLPNGNRLGLFLIELDDENNSFGYTVIREVDAQGTLLWEALLTSDVGLFLQYRVERLSLYRDADDDLHLGQPAILLIPETVLEANGVS